MSNLFIIILTTPLLTLSINNNKQNTLTFSYNFNNQSNAIFYPFTILHFSLASSSSIIIIIIILLNNILHKSIMHLIIFNTRKLIPQTTN